MFAEPFWITLCGILTITYIACYTYGLLREMYVTSKQTSSEINPGTSDKYDDTPVDYSTPYKPHRAAVYPIGRLSPYVSDPIREQLKGKRPLRYYPRGSSITTSNHHMPSAASDTPLLVPSVLFDDYFTNKANDECIDGRKPASRHPNSSGWKYPW